MTDKLGRQFLCACFTDNKNFEAGLDGGLTPSHFENTDYQKLWVIMRSAEEYGTMLDPYRLMRLDDRLSPVIADLISEPTVQSVKHLIFDLRFRRWKKETMRRAKEWFCFVESADTDEGIKSRFAELGSAVESLDEAPKEKCGAAVHAEAIDEIEKTYLAKNSGRVIGTPSGIPSLDRCLSGGFKPGELIVLGALTGKGKTHIGVSFTMNALRNGKRVCYVTIEMAATGIMKRMIACESGLNSKILTSGAFDERILDAQMDAVAKSAGVFMGKGLIIADETNGSFEALETLIRKLGRSESVDLLVIDYIQQFYFDKPSQNRVSELNQITSKVKHLTKKYRFATVMLAQLNREAQKDKERGKAHSSHQFEQSHSMAKDSDIILILDEENIGGQEFLYLAKNRNGEDGLRFAVNLDRRVSRIMEAM